MIEREVFDWGVRLTARPFKRTKIQTMVIRSEVGLYKPGRGCGVRITFSAASFQSALRLLDAQTWNEGMAAIINETRSVMADMKAKTTKAKSKKKQASPTKRSGSSQGNRYLNHRGRVGP